MYNSNLNLNLYKVFYDVAQYGSVSLASKNLLISQPAISRSIKKLEEDLNVTLFYRTLNGMILTEKGRELLEYVEEACNSLIIGERTMMETNSLEKGKLTIGVPSYIASFYLNDAVLKFHNMYPEIEISLISRPVNELIKLLEAHELDFIISPSPIPTFEKELHIESLSNHTHIFVSSSQTKEEIKELKDLEQYPLILPSNKNYDRQCLNEIFRTSKVSPKNIISMEDDNMIKSTVLNQGGIGYVLADHVEKELQQNQVHEIKIEKNLPYTTINLVYIDKYLTKAPSVFIENFLKKNSI